MSGAHIRTRVTKNGRRYDVRYRLGGRGYPILHGGTFRTQAEARARRDLIAGELANGRDPRHLLEQLRNPPAPVTLDAVYEAFIETRIDVHPKTAAGYRNSRARLGALANRDPHSITVADWQKWITDNADLAPSTLSVHLSNHRQVMDYADVHPNTARSPKLRMPASDQDAEPVPPSTAEWEAIKQHVRPRSLLILRLVECDALRISEAVALEYGDVDFSEGRIRISATRTKGRRGHRRGRWVPVPPDLLNAIANLCPLEDRSRDRRVFRQLTDSVVRHDLALACRDAGIVHYHPHDLRHRRISLWVADGIDPVTVKTWAGHTRASMSTDRYGHVIVPADDEWRRFWRTAYDRQHRLRTREELPREAWVIHDTGEDV